MLLLCGACVLAARKELCRVELIVEENNNEAARVALVVIEVMSDQGLRRKQLLPVHAGEIVCGEAAFVLH